MKTKSVLISGIGIAGPTLAYWLERFGLQPTLVERAPHPRTSGYIIDFWGLGYDIAERMGLLPELREFSYQVSELRLVDDRGRRAGGFGIEVFRKLTGGRYVSVPRGDLARLIYRQVEGRCEAIFDDSVVRIEPRGDGVEVGFERAPARRFDLVIGADGLHSAVRALSFGPEDRFEHRLGYVAAAFAVEGYRPRDEGVYVSYGAPGLQAARFALRDDRTMFLLVFATERAPQIDLHDDRATQKARLRAAFAGAGWECGRILEALDGCGELYFDRVSQIRIDGWSRGRVALVGDAAFAPSLLAGQGSALAMTAAYVLAGELAADRAHPEAALRRYEDRLRGFMLGKQRAAARFARSFAPRTRFGLAWRNRITRLFAIPGIAMLTMGGTILDRLELPDYCRARG